MVALSKSDHPKPISYDLPFLWTTLHGCGVFGTRASRGIKRTRIGRRSPALGKVEPVNFASHYPSISTLAQHQRVCKSMILVHAWSTVVHVAGNTGMSWI